MMRSRTNLPSWMAWGEGGEIATWGSGTAAGHGDRIDVLLPRRVECLRGRIIVEACGGGSHTLARCEEGGVYSWGSGAVGQLGHGTTEELDRRRTLTQTLP